CICSGPGSWAGSRARNAGNNPGSCIVQSGREPGSRLRWPSLWRKFMSLANILRSGSLLLVSVVAAGQPALAQSPSRKLPTIPFEKYKLKNGLEVILSEDRTLPLVSVNIWYHVGPANEKAGS